LDLTSTDSCQTPVLYERGLVLIHLLVGSYSSILHLTWN